MNRENIKKVRDHIASLPPEQFDMSGWGEPHTCGTAACIGGWADRLILAPKMPDRTEFQTYETVAALGLSTGQGSALFFPQDTSPGGPYDATPAQAVAVLDHLLETGEVDWTVAQGVTQ